MPVAAISATRAAVASHSVGGVNQFTQRFPEFADDYGTALVRTNRTPGTEEAMSDIGKLLESHLPSMRRYAQTMTRNADRIDDLVQTCAVRALANQHLWREGSDLRAWLFTILHNQFVDESRRHNREEKRRPIAGGAPPMLPCTDPEMALRLRECSAALSKLPGCEKQIVLLATVQGIAYRDLAVMLDIPVGSVASRLARARVHLRHLTDEAASSKKRDGANASTVRLAA